MYYQCILCVRRRTRRAAQLIALLAAGGEDRLNDRTGGDKKIHTSRHANEQVLLAKGANDYHIMFDPLISINSCMALTETMAMSSGIALSHRLVAYCLRSHLFHSVGDMSLCVSAPNASIQFNILFYLSVLR